MDLLTALIVLPMEAAMAVIILTVPMVEVLMTEATMMAPMMMVPTTTEAKNIK